MQDIFFCISVFVFLFIVIVFLLILLNKVKNKSEVSSKNNDNHIKEINKRTGNDNKGQDIEIYSTNLENAKISISYKGWSDTSNDVF